MTNKFSKQEKKVYFEKLRLDWQRSKALAKNDMKAEALYRESGLKGVSYYSFHYVLKQLRALKLKGLPYIDCKTYHGWQTNGFKVKKGEKSKIKGITWLAVKEDGKMANQKDKKEDIKFLYPKIYSLFHKNQIEEL